MPEFKYRLFNKLNFCKCSVTPRHKEITKNSLNAYQSKSKIDARKLFVLLLQKPTVANLKKQFIGISTERKITSKNDNSKNIFNSTLLDHPEILTSKKG